MTKTIIEKLIFMFWNIISHPPIYKLKKVNNFVNGSIKYRSTYYSYTTYIWNIRVSNEVDSEMHASVLTLSIFYKKEHKSGNIWRNLYKNFPAVLHVIKLLYTKYYRRMPNKIRWQQYYFKTYIQVEKEKNVISGLVEKRKISCLHIFFLYRMYLYRFGVLSKSVSEIQVLWCDNA